MSENSQAELLCEFLTSDIIGVFACVTDILWILNQVSVFIASVVGKIYDPKMNLDSQGHSIELLLCLLQPTLKVTSALTENLAFSPARSALHYAINLFFSSLI